MSDDKTPYSARNIAHRWSSQQRENERRDSLFGGRNQQHWESTPISDIKNVVISCAGAGLMIGMFSGALTAQNDHAPLLQGFLIGAAKGAGIGAIAGFALAKAAALTSFSGAALRDFDAAHGMLLAAAWKGAKWGAAAGGGAALVSRNWPAFIGWALVMAVFGAAAGAVIKAVRNLGRKRLNL
ncbi:MAG: hypothetical protein PW788_04270 [Micavibrio sp.]|nr:hypothetical protein [Micavibrio sp.]